MTLQVSMMAWTSFNTDLAKELTGWRPDVAGGQALVEFAGRACYQSWDKPNPTTSSNQGYLAHILDVGHGSILEHATVTFYCTGVSRPLTHELIRHRVGTAYSELSQRYVDMAEVGFVVPPAVERYASADAVADWKDGFEEARKDYELLVSGLTAKGLPRKQAREAARAVMPNMTETKIVMTANFRAWRHILRMRGSVHADAEIRRWAVAVAWQLKRHAPNVFQDMEIESTNTHGDIIRFAY